MKLAGFELRHFRSIGAEPVELLPLRRCNILVGQNNAGKSNVLRAVQKVSNRYQQKAGKDQEGLDALDYFMRQGGNPFRARIFFELEDQPQTEADIRNLVQSSRIWFDISWEPGKPSGVINNSFAELSDFEQANSLLYALTGRKWTSPVSPGAIQKEFIEQGGAIFTNRFQACIPPVYLVPEFRQIRPGEQYSLDGVGIIDMLARFQNPDIGKDQDWQKFEQIQEFTRRLLDLPQATLDVTRDEPKKIIIKTDGLRLPIASYGTGVHELLILVTAVLSIEDAICCIEEPEIHLHPRLQREFMEFLLKDTNNQYLLSTHSSSLINIADNDVQVFRIWAKDGATIGRPALQTYEGLQAVRDLGLRASDLLQSNCVIWVEGPSDRIYIRRWLELVSPDLREGPDFLFMYYSGLVQLHIDAEAASDEVVVNVLQLNQNAILVMDSDCKSQTEELAPSKRALKERVEATGGLGWVTDGREIENYIPASVLKRTCKALRGEEVAVDLELHAEFEAALNQALNMKNLKPIDYSNNKLSYSRKFAELCSLEELSGDLKEQIGALASKIRDWKA